jgi:hypothetical protein
VEERVPKSNLEGVERRLSEPHDEIEVRDTTKEREQSSVADIQGIEVALTPPKSLVQALGDREGYACAQAFELVWPSGPWKGLPITGYCAEPRCINEGSCTGTRFVPHIDQWTTTNPDLRSRRVPGPKEIVAAVRLMAKKAAAQTGRDEERSDSEILAHVKLVWTKTLESIRGKDGEWRR